MEKQTVALLSGGSIPSPRTMNISDKELRGLIDILNHMVEASSPDKSEPQRPMFWYWFGMMQGTMMRYGLDKAKETEKIWTCQHCMGHGYVFYKNEKTDCPVCHGAGEI